MESSSQENDDGTNHRNVAAIYIYIYSTLTEATGTISETSSPRKLLFIIFQSIFN